VDYDSGDDSNVGYSDVSLAAAGAVALKTLTRLREILPPVGNGRIVMIGIKPRAAGANYLKPDGITIDDLDLTGLVGYGVGLVRATDFTNTTADKLTCAGQTVSGPYTVAAAPAPTANTFEIASGTLPAEPAVLQKRLRFTSGALANASSNVWSNTGTSITLGNDLSAAPAAGDTFVIEEPAVRVRRILYSNTVSSPRQVTPIGRWAIVGVAAVETTTDAILVSAATAGVTLSFCEITSSIVNAGLLMYDSVSTLSLERSYIDEGGASRITGTGLRSNSRGVWNNLVSVLVSASGFFSSSPSQFSQVYAYQIGRRGSAWHGGAQVFMIDCGRSSRSSGSSGSIFGTPAGSTQRPVRFDGSHLEWRHSDGNIISAQFENVVGNCLNIAGVGVRLGISGLTGTTGNTGYGISMGSNGTQLSTIVLGNVLPNTVSGALGEFEMVGSAITTHASFEVTNVVDTGGNNVGATDKVYVGQCVQVLNKSGSACTVGDLVRSNEYLTGEVVKAQADVEANAKVVGVMVTPAADDGYGYMAPVGQVAWVNFSSPPVLGGIAYLSEATAGQARTSAPTYDGTVHKQRLGRIVMANGSMGRVVLHPELLSAISDGGV
jgi:hypothetical protein